MIRRWTLVFLASAVVLGGCSATSQSKAAQAQPQLHQGRHRAHNKHHGSGKHKRRKCGCAGTVTQHGGRGGKGGYCGKGAHDAKGGYCGASKGDDVHVHGFERRECGGTVESVVEAFTNGIKARKLTLMLTLDHAANAKKAGAELAPTTLLIFGNPKVGSSLMASQPSVAIDLPMKLLVWRDGDGKVHAGYNRPGYLRKRHRLDAQRATLETMGGVIKELVAEACPTTEKAAKPST